LIEGSLLFYRRHDKVGIVNDVTRILESIEHGDPKAADELLPLVYQELRKLAAHKMAQEAPGQTLQPTALVHEAWLRLTGGDGQAQFKNRAYFFAAAAEAMRRTLIERARRKRTQRYGGGQQQVELEALDSVPQKDDDQLLALNDALDKLAAQNKVEAELVKLRYFVGMTSAEAAEVLGISESIAKHYWIHARTLATLGLRTDDQGRTVYLDPPKAGNEEIRARITQAPVSSVPPLDAALELAPAEALTAVQQLADQHPGTMAYQKLLGRIHADCVSSTADQGLWSEALAHADAAIRLEHDDPYTRYQRALACLGAGDAAGYRATCRDLAARYQFSNDPDVIKWVGWSAALAAGGLDDYEGIIEQMRRAAPRVSGLHGPAYRFYLGAVLLRGGQYQAAADEFEQVDRHLKAAGTGVDFSPVYNEFLLAVCQAHLGNDALARQWFDAAQVDVRNLLKSDQGAIPSASTTS
jgi:RNA polymerase sigma factor (TIGR02999 family)